MLVFWKSLECMHLEPIVFQMTLQNVLGLMALYGIADAHHFFSINDLQFFALMNTLTDLPLKTINAFFFKLDMDYAGEMNFVEFQLLCSWMIAAKDGVTKEYLQRHFYMFVKLMETGGKRRNYVPLYDFVKIGHFMGWNLGTMDRLYKYWDRSFEIERYRVKLEFVMTFIIFAIDHEKALISRKRINAIKDWRKRWLFNLDNVILDYYLHGAVPAPPLIWSQMTETDPPFVKAMKETKEEKGLCEYFIRIYCGFICMPWVVGLGSLYLIWANSNVVRKAFRWTLSLFICKPCWPCFNRISKRWPLPHDNPKNYRVKVHSSAFYYRNKKKRREKPTFEYLQKQREVDGLFSRIDPWQNNWLKTQLHLEKMEKQLLNNRIEYREENMLVLKDTWGSNAVNYENYVDKELGYPVTYKQKADLPFRPAPPVKSNIVIDSEDILRAKYPSRFFRNYSAKEILRANYEVLATDYRVTKGARRKEPYKTFGRLRETVGGLARLRKKEIEKIRKMSIESEEEEGQAVDGHQLNEDARKSHYMTEGAWKSHLKRNEESEIGRDLSEGSETEQDSKEDARKGQKLKKEDKKGGKLKAETDRFNKLDDWQQALHLREEGKKAHKLKREAEKLKKESDRLQKMREEAEKLQKAREEAEKLQKLKEEAANLLKLKKEAEKLEKLKEEAEKLQKLKEEAEKFQKLKEEAEKLQKLKDEGAKPRKSDEGDKGQIMKEMMEKQWKEEALKQQKLKEELEKGRKLKEEAEKAYWTQEMEKSRKSKVEADKTQKLKEEAEKQRKWTEDKEKEKKLKEELRRGLQKKVDSEKAGPSTSKQNSERRQKSRVDYEKYRRLDEAERKRIQSPGADMGRPERDKEAKRSAMMMMAGERLKNDIALKIQLREDEERAQRKRSESGAELKLMKKSMIGPKVKTESVTGQKLKAKSVTAQKLKAKSVTTQKWKAKSVTGSKLQTPSVRGQKLQAESLRGQKLKVDSVKGPSARPSKRKTSEEGRKGQSQSQDEKPDTTSQRSKKSK